MNEITYFERFWSCYPRKVGKGNAEKSWKKLTPDEPLFTKIVLAIDAQVRHRRKIEELNRGQTNERYKKFLPDWPHPATWLNQQRWLDELQSVKEATVEVKEKEFCPECQKKGKQFEEFIHMNNHSHLCSWHFSESTYQQGPTGLIALRNEWQKLSVKRNGETWRNAIAKAHPQLMKQCVEKIGSSP